MFFIKACIQILFCLHLVQPFQLPFLSSHNELPTRKEYHANTVLRFPIGTTQDYEDILEAVKLLDLDVWSRTKHHWDVRVAQDQTRELFQYLPQHMVHDAECIVRDVEHAIRQVLPSLEGDQFLQETVPNVNDTFFADFQNMEAINAWMALMVAMYGEFTSIVDLGKTYEGRAIHGLRISTVPISIDLKKKSKRKVILVHGAQHAREWISVSTVCYLAYSLITGRGVDSSISKLVDDFDWIFIPTVNADGYAYTFEDRLWRKNRQPTTVPYCKGIDLDRNWGYGWDFGKDIHGLVSSPCSENFQGNEPFEATETSLLSQYILTLKSDPRYQLVGYLDLHSYAQTILYPYALSCDIHVRDEESLIELGVGAGKAMHATSGQYYDTESACDQDGHVLANGNSGAALDWVYHTGVPWSYVIKLRDTGSYGFLVPKEEIIPTGEEMLGFVKYFAKFITEH